MNRYSGIKYIFLFIILYLVLANYLENSSSCECNRPKCNLIYLKLNQCKRIGETVSLTLTDYSIFPAEIIQAHFIYSNGTIVRKYLTDALYPFKTTTIDIPNMDVKFDKIVVTGECKSIEIRQMADDCFSIYSNFESGS